MFCLILKNPLTPKISLVTLSTVCHTILMMSFRRIWYLINYRNFQPFTCMANYCIQWKKKSTDYPHWWITYTLKAKEICTKLLDRMQIHGHILCERSFSAMLICWFLKKIDISGSTGLNKSLKQENSLQLKLVLTGNLSLMRRLSLVYFCHHQGFVYTHADSNLFVAQLM